MRARIHTRYFRFVSVLLATVMIFTSTAEGLHAGALFFNQELLRLLRAQGPFTDRPTPIFKGTNPRRDPIYRAGRWTPQSLAALNRVRYEQQAMNPEFWSAGLFGNLPALPVFQGGGGSGGGEGGGEGGGSGGGSGGGGGPSSSGGASGDSSVGTGSGSGGSSGGPSSSSVNTNTGNRLYQLPIVSWPSRGQIGIGLTLSHSSLGDSWSGAFGTAWSHSYEWKIDYSTNEYCLLHTGDGSDISFSESGGVFTPPVGIYLTLVHNSNGTWTLTSKHGAKVEFNSNGYATSIKDRNANAVTLAYNSNNKVTTATDPGGKVLTFAYNSNNRVSSVTDTASRVWTFSYTGTDLTSITMPTLNSNSYSRTYTYNSTHDILTEVDLRGNTWTQTYDSTQRMTSWKNPLNETTSYSFGTSATTITLPGAQTIVHNYSSGLLASEVDPASYSSSYTYDSSKNRLTVTDKRGKVWTFTYDTKGNVLTAKNPLNQTTTITYNSAFSQPLTMTNPLSNVTTKTYDSNGNLLTVVDPLSNTRATIAYNSYGDATSVQDALSRTTSGSYDSNGNVTSVTTPGSVTTTAAYDSLNRPTSVTDANSNATSTSYDAWGRGTVITHPGSSTIQKAYNNENQLTTLTDELSNTTTIAYNTAMRVTSVTNARGDIESYSYNSNGWRTGVTNGRNYSRTYTINSRGEVTALTMPDSTTEGWSFNANGQIGAYTNGLSQTVNYAYDDAGRMTTVDYPTGTDTAFTYDSAGRRTQMVDGTGTTGWTINAAGQVTAFSAPQGSVSHAFNNAGQPTTMTETGLGSTSYSYNSAGQLSSLTNRFSEATSFNYDSVGRVSKKTFSSGAYEDYSYDSRGRVTAVSLKNSSNSALRSQSYEYDNASNVTSHTVDSLATTYGYDAIGQLLSEARIGYSASYTYDANGNRATRTVGGVTETYTNDSGDKLTGVTWSGGSKSFGYDGAGRTTSIVTSAGTTTLSYDYEARVTGITYPSSATNSFGYNGFDARISKTDPASTSTYRRLGAGATAPVLGDGSASFTPGLSERRGSTTTFQHSGIKNADAQSGTGQTLSATRQYDAFGNIESSTGTFQGAFGYGGGFGYQSDADSNLKLLGHRYYDSSTGRFVTRDPARDGRNWFAYCGNSPASKADPKGLMMIQALALIIDLPPPFPPGESLDANIAVLRAWEAGAVPINPWDLLDPIGFATNTRITSHELWTAYVAPGGQWDYKLQHHNPEVYDDAGNYNYGGTGAYLGIPLWTLLLVGEVDAGAIYLEPDQADDIYWIKRGYYDYHH